MSYITLKCKNCGANMSLNTESLSATCIHCGSTFLISEILEEKDRAFMSKLSPLMLEQKMLASDAIKHGETYLFQCEYEKAEASFKKAIELDDSNFKSYLGIVKAKTKNFNIVPENDDYLQYAHYALSLATGDDLILVKSELAKIKLLEREKIRQKKYYAVKTATNSPAATRKREISNVFTIITIFIILMASCFMFISTVYSDFIFGKSDLNPSINVNSYDSLERVFSNEKYLDYNINLTADIDCGGKKLIPFGSQQKAFTGSFNGNNFKISNLIIDGTNKHHVGLFGYTLLANIKNVVFDKVTLDVKTSPSTSFTSAYGIVVGKAQTSTISNIEIKNSCYISVIRDIDYPTSIGGVVGSATNSSFISNISSHANFGVRLTQIVRAADSYVGGIVGSVSNSIVQSTCSNSAIYSTVSNTCYKTSSTFLGGIIGSIISPSVTDVSNTTNNYFSGLLCLSASDITKTHLSAIAECSLRSTKMLNNTCLYTSTNFILNSSYVSIENLKDFTQNEYFVDFCTSNDSYISRLSKTFKNWSLANTLEPTLPSDLRSA